ncbi:V-type ATP synthase subunit I [Haloferax mediterranei ATCC 33500]|uniref:A-type ATP synthase subunit I n=1 Tax=Haloferax mediterranei (strain ATCC 33500 / DSM 1411 / JCM 8866 / NBRC 14739 / NCIMB 2177 / R-4) TaxID=523841 RepID=I3R1C6_HALMT|nr:V-type ATPase 116kDa subunit family protein [Haloferax mediterranei]AFK18036.1 A-type ATP synthase subunit I [Haloferax mediterranei ATCC 33500]AHZ22550.1 ATP synthase subunit I [Haloferax mediterranei ATCC 33500]EMA02688.1 A-type ATP synthase subunit I [Haloferax mediterranei ATCC 33500]MDX5988128.1 V-type ATPase 116kDa subunit family protein [Haloferax mediterranei ATCC 33500]QCQ74577.1 V-type ATP synthase subunit I [Haloferax mediterranei ATCC 33500]
MLRPEQMSKVSVTGSKGVMPEVIEAVHDLRLLHVTEYDGSWQEEFGFETGTPIEGAESASDKLVTVRSLKSILGVEDSDAGRQRIVPDDALGEPLEEIRTEVNELDDRRSELENKLRAVDEEIDAMEPFVDLGIDLDLLSGYDTLQVVVGHGNRDEIERAVVDAGEINAYEIFSGERTHAIFGRPTEGASEMALTDALVGAEFATLEVPDASGSPEDHIRDLEQEKRELESKLETVESELHDIAVEEGEFLLAAEERLDIDVQKTEAPLSFATTENAFVAEGWIPTERYNTFASELKSIVGEHVDVEELERAEFSHDGHDHAREGVPEAGGTAAATDGGAVTMSNDEPPVVQNNSGAVKPFELLVQAVNRPNYYEFDPTVILFLTFPAFFGFMIGDFGYGVIYTAIGYYLYAGFESETFKSMGGMTIAAGLFTTLFGILYGEIFGFHLITQYLWEGALGLSHPPIEKGLSPATSEWALGWLTVSVVVGIFHLNVGYIFDFVEKFQLHGAKEAVLEAGSWILMLNGLWIWVFSDALGGVPPEFLFTTFASGGLLPLGFSGFSYTVGWAGLGLYLLGAAFLAMAEPAELAEFASVLSNVLSYTRLGAVLIAKASMAFAVNLLVFGVYTTGHGGEVEWHFGLGHMPHIGEMVHGHEVTNILFGGLFHSGAAGVVGGLLVLVVGHLVVLALGVTSAGLQAVRLEYVEFFGKFFEGGGREYEPFGYDRQFTTED